jgi:uncharacterized peroxidase-related enzyme
MNGGPVAFVDIPEPTAATKPMLDDDIAELGFVMNTTRLWTHRPSTHTGLFDLMMEIVDEYGLTDRQRGILVGACASTLGDSYCALAWGRKLAAASDAPTAAAVLRCEDTGLTTAERAMANWARMITRDPNATGPTEVQTLRDAGFSDDQIFALTAFVALRIAFSTVNDALGARPDAQFRTIAPPAVVEAVTFGRPIAEQ